MPPKLLSPLVFLLLLAFVGLPSSASASCTDGCARAEDGCKDACGEDFLCRMKCIPAAQSCREECADTAKHNEAMKRLDDAALDSELCEGFNPDRHEQERRRRVEKERKEKERKEQEQAQEGE